MTGLFPTIVLKGRPLFKRERAEGEKKDKTRKKEAFFVVPDKNMGQNEGMCKVRKSALEQRMER